jgi:hypothetical protein
MMEICFQLGGKTALDEHRMPIAFDRGANRISEYHQGSRRVRPKMEEPNLPLRQRWWPDGPNGEPGRPYTT